MAMALHVVVNLAEVIALTKQQKCEGRAIGSPFDGLGAWFIHHVVTGCIKQHAARRELALALRDSAAPRRGWGWGWGSAAAAFGFAALACARPCCLLLGTAAFALCVSRPSQRPTALFDGQNPVGMSNANRCECYGL
jgi:hypothetical protein